VTELARVVKEGDGPNLRAQLNRNPQYDRVCGAWTPTALDPRSPGVVVWNICVLAALVALFILVPIELAFVPFDADQSWAEKTDVGRGLHSFSFQLNLRTIGNTLLPLELNLSTFGPHPRVTLGHMWDKVSLS
jgi:hypothetical protein